MKHNRRSFLQKTALASTALGLSMPLMADMTQNTTSSKPFNMLYAPHFGMFAQHAGNDHIDQLKFMREHGFRALEDNGMMSRPVELQERIGKTMADLGMKMGVFVVEYDNWPLKTSLTSGSKEWLDKFIAACKKAVEVAKRVNATYMTVVPGNYDRNLPIGIQTSHVIEALRRGAEIFEPHGLVMVLEPLSDTPDLFLRYTDQTHMICKAVNSPSCKILFDMYHMQRNEGRITRNIDLTWDEIAYFQIGDEPGRNEPTSGEVNYTHLFNHIHQKAVKSGKTFIMGMEHGNAFPGKEGELKLIEAYRSCDIKL